MTDVVVHEAPPPEPAAESAAAVDAVREAAHAQVQAEHAEETAGAAASVATAAEDRIARVEQKVDVLLEQMQGLIAANVAEAEVVAAAVEELQTAPPAEEATVIEPTPEAEHEEEAESSGDQPEPPRDRHSGLLW